MTVNLKQAFEKTAELYEDTLRSAVVGWHDRDEKAWDARDKLFPVESWEAAGKKIDYEYDAGYGGADCHAVIAWGDKNVYFVHEYDGSTGIACVPRQPTECAPYYGDLWR